ncbi:MAG: acetyl-CoA carboxylase carboxyltransferase subunit alpha [bacterium]|nr:acetyl-CoA carboxylase carboxyltransferase subunit alpha [bacterium]
MKNYLEFEKPIADLHSKISDFSNSDNVNCRKMVQECKLELNRTRKEIFKNLTTWEKVQLARHPDRPYAKDYITSITDDFLQLHGDRLYADDEAIIGGIAKINGKSIMIIGHQKGRNVQENMRCNFGMPHPEGYRKALRLMRMAEKFNLPLITLIDTPGAYPGIGAEERGQAEAIAQNLKVMANLKVPIICIVIGEGGSGGALAIGVGDTLAMLEYTIYSVISPEGCASILWRDASMAPKAAEALKLLAEDLKKLHIIDKVLKEPLGGAHNNPKKIAQTIKKFIISELEKLEKDDLTFLLTKRYNKLREVGEFMENKSLGTF